MIPDSSSLAASEGRGTTSCWGSSPWCVSVSCWRLSSSPWGILWKKGRRELGRRQRPVHAGGAVLTAASCAWRLWPWRSWGGRWCPRWRAAGSGWVWECWARWSGPGWWSPGLPWWTGSWRPGLPWCTGRWPWKTRRRITSTFKRQQVPGGRPRRSWSSSTRIYGDGRSPVGQEGHRSLVSMFIRHRTNTWWLDNDVIDDSWNQKNQIEMFSPKFWSDLRSWIDYSEVRTH